MSMLFAPSLAPTVQCPLAQGCAAGATLGPQRLKISTLKGLRPKRAPAATLSGLGLREHLRPRVAAAREPWAIGRCPVGTRNGMRGLLLLRLQHCVCQLFFLRFLLLGRILLALEIVGVVFTEAITKANALYATCKRWSEMKIVPTRSNANATITGYNDALM
jgi:hypothetical protein